MSRLKGRIAVVTGAASGIGKGIAIAFAREGANVVIADKVTEEHAAEVVAGVRGHGGEALFVQTDVSDEDSVRLMAEAALARFGRVDILVNNAGIARSGTAGEEVSDELWLNVNDVNYNGVFWCCRAFGRHMLKARKGSIVNIGSMSGYIVNRPQKQAYYNASKAAVHHLTASLAAEWADRGVRVNAVAPTYIETPMVHGVPGVDAMMKEWLRDTPMNRLGQPHEIASVVQFLASEAASLMTGTTVLADGGFTCW
jgi:NAD(P)-dependent dehydrogenase (short-subunit alcohol dehydrogenase family)